MQPPRKRYPRILSLPSIVLLVCCIPLFTFVWSVRATPAHSAYAQALSRSAQTASSPVSVTITSPTAGTSYIAPAVIFMGLDANSTAGTITRIQLTDVLAPGPVGSPTPGTIATNGSTTGALSSTTTHTGAVPLTTPPPRPSCNDPVTIPCVTTIFPYMFQIENVQAGRHVFIATAFDSSGNRAISSVYIPVTSVQPVVTILTPSANATFTAPAQVALTASTSKFPGTITDVMYFNGTEFIGSATTAPYSLAWNVVRAGTYTVTATAFDSLGNARDSAPVTITVNPLGVASCKVQYQVVSQWPGGFSTNVTITNMGTTAINSWSLQFGFGGDQKITNWWSGQFTQSGQQVTVTNVSYNGSIAPQATTNLGFNGSWNSSNASPTSFTLNGQSCTLA